MYKYLMVFACVGLMVVLTQGIAIGESQEKCPFSISSCASEEKEGMCCMDMDNMTLMDMLDEDNIWLPFQITMSEKVLKALEDMAGKIMGEIGSLSEIKMDELPQISLSMNGDHSIPAIKFDMIPNNLLDMFDSENFGSASFSIAIPYGDNEENEENEGND
jgi:hypothetical protein